MAVIGKIREKSWLILILVGGALLAFILTDYNKMTGGMDSVYGIGTVYGEKVDFEAFNRDVAQAEENARLNAQQSGQQPQPVDRDAVWNAFVEKLILDKEFGALGIQVGDAEFDAYLYGTEGFKVQPDLLQGFTDSTGQFNANLLRQRIEQMQTSDKPEEQKMWDDSKKYYTEKRMKEKYYDILSQGMYVTTLEAKNEYVAQKEIKTISYVLKRYSQIKDEDIKVTDEKLRAYYEEHKNDKKYENKVAMRSVKYIDIAIEPSRTDSTEFDRLMENLKKEFATAKNDSLFVMNNSEIRFFSSKFTFRPEGDPKAKQGMTYPAYMDTVISKAQKGQIVGPYFENGSEKIAKVLDFNTKLLTARHILIAANKSDDAAVAKAKKKVDSLMPLINKDNFEDFVTKHSDDPGSKNTGGKYEDFMDFEMVPEFSNFAVNEPIGKIGYVQTDFGFHVMEVIERKETKLPVLAIVQKTLKPSQETIDKTDTKVYELLYKLDGRLSQKENPSAKIQLFDTLVSKQNHSARPIFIEDNNPKVRGFQSKAAEDAILQLAYAKDAKIGDLVSSPVRDKDRYIIAVLSTIKEKGAPSFEEIEEIIKHDYIKAEKAKRFKASMASKSLKAIADNDNMVNIEKAEITFANPQITGAGFEPEVIGAIFSGLKDGARSIPLEGNMGVYVIQIEKTTKAAAQANYQLEKDQLLSTSKGNLQGETRKALIKRADVIDNRRFNEIGVRH